MFVPPRLTDSQRLRRVQRQPALHCRIALSPHGRPDLASIAVQYSGMTTPNPPLLAWVLLSPLLLLGALLFLFLEPARWALLVALAAAWSAAALRILGRALIARSRQARPAFYTLVCATVCALVVFAATQIETEPARLACTKADGQPTCFEFHQQPLVQAELAFSLVLLMALLAMRLCAPNRARRLLALRLWRSVDRGMIVVPLICLGALPVLLTGLLSFNISGRSNEECNQDYWKCEDVIVPPHDYSYEIPLRPVGNGPIIIAPREYVAVSMYASDPMSFCWPSKAPGAAAKTRDEPCFSINIQAGDPRLPHAELARAAVEGRILSSHMEPGKMHRLVVKPPPPTPQFERLRVPGTPATQELVYYLATRYTDSLGSPPVAVFSHQDGHTQLDGIRFAWKVDHWPQGVSVNLSTYSLDIMSEQDIVREMPEIYVEARRILGLLR